MTDELLKQIGQRIQWLREATGHTQAQWARALKVTPQKLNKWEAGTRTPNLDDLVIIVKSTRASFDYLFLGRLTYEMNPELLEHFREGMVRPQRGRIAAALRRGQERGEVRADLDCELAAEALMGSFMFHFLTSGRPAKGWSERVVDTLWPGFAS